MVILLCISSIIGVPFMNRYTLSMDPNLNDDEAFASFSPLNPLETPMMPTFTQLQTINTEVPFRELERPVTIPTRELKSAKRFQLPGPDRNGELQTIAIGNGARILTLPGNPGNFDTGYGKQSRSSLQMEERETPERMGVISVPDAPEFQISGGERRHRENKKTWKTNEQYNFIDDDHEVATETSPAVIAIRRTVLTLCLISLIIFFIFSIFKEKLQYFGLTLKRSCMYGPFRYFAKQAFETTHSSQEPQRPYFRLEKSDKAGNYGTTEPGVDIDNQKDEDFTDSITNKVQNDIGPVPRLTVSSLKDPLGDITVQENAPLLPKESAKSPQIDPLGNSPVKRVYKNDDRIAKRDDPAPIVVDEEEDVVAPLSSPTVSYVRPSVASLPMPPAVSTLSTTDTDDASSAIRPISKEQSDRESSKNKNDDSLLDEYDFLNEVEEMLKDDFSASGKSTESGP